MVWSGPSSTQSHGRGAFFSSHFTALSAGIPACFVAPTFQLLDDLFLSFAKYALSTSMASGIRPEAHAPVYLTFE